MLKLNLTKNKMDKLRLENLLYKQAKHFQQIFYELCSDYHTFYFDALNDGIKHLKNFIGYTLFGLHLSTYNHEQIHITEKLYNKIVENSNDKGTIYCGLIFNVVYFTQARRNADKYIYPIPVFKVGNFKGDRHTIKYDTVPLNVTYIDIGGRVYKNWQEYLAKNTLKNMTMIVPYEGIYSMNPVFPSGRFSSTVYIEKILSQTTDDPNCIMNPRWDTDVTVSGGVSILLGGCWQNIEIRNRISIYIAIDNIPIHGLPYKFNPPTINENYINYGKLNGTDVLKLSEHIMYIGNCIIPEQVLKNLLMYPNDDNILFEYEAQLREIRHTTEHQHKHKDALNNVKENIRKRYLVIRELKTIKTREEMILDSTIYSITEIIKREDPIKFIKLIQEKDKTNDITEVEPAGELVDDSVKPYIEKVLECLRTVFKYLDPIPPLLMKKLVQSITGIKRLGVGYDLFCLYMTLVSSIVNKAHPNKLKSLMGSTLIVAFDFFFNYLKIFSPIITKLLPTSLPGALLLVVINVVHLYIMDNIDCIADYLTEKIAKYTQCKSIPLAPKLMY
ncbi:uncharacterized protein LOC107264103 [Cephus cinctus]|uniref:Uncharacterized protein LOC107264103 n=1 Tax=Cephus cinctus TaxID=211228 RepID=A0AAJ7BJB4_CEPCN|nr:uncharacterized protein LOC107264103 [Cephus cinctus]